MRKYTLYPFLISLYPVLFLYAHNVDRTPFPETVRTFAWIVLATLAIFALIWLLFRNVHRAALFTAFAMLVFSTYGHAYNALSGKQLAGIPIGHADVLASVWLSVFILGGWAILRLVRKPQAPTMLLNIIAVCLFCLPLVQIGTYLAGKAVASANKGEVASAETVSMTYRGSGERPPDVYYIILDEYGREDVMKEIMGFDNAAFMRSLEDRGFYVATESKTNYPFSDYAIATSLNMQYMDDWSKLADNYFDNFFVMIDVIHTNETIKRFEQLGYHTVTFSTGFFPTEIKNVDQYIEPDDYLNRFETEYLTSTFFAINPDWIHADRARAVLKTPLDKLPEIAASDPDTPKFVFVHIPAAHIPFVFGAQGEEVPLWAMDPGGEGAGTYKQVYTAQVQYMNRLVSAAIDGVLENSPVPPIIILQSDHGPQSLMTWLDVDSTCLTERMSILNAYYVPDSVREKLYRGITPVNSFRLIFDELFGAGYGLLDDKVYFVYYTQSTEAMDVTDRADTCAALQK